MVLQEGSTYELEIPIRVNGEDIDIEDVSLIEFTFGEVRKIYGIEDEKQGTVTYDSERKLFIVPLTQEDTFKLENEIYYQCRIKFNDNKVNGSPIYTGYLLKSISEEVL